MLYYEDYKKINELRENNKEIYNLILKISDYCLDSASLGCHDLRNHAALISGYCQLLSMTEPSITQNSYFQKIELSSKNLINLFDEIARFRYSFKNGEYCESNIKDLLTEAIQNTCEEFPGLTLNINFEDKVLSKQYPFTCDATHMLNAFCAILTNSVEASLPDPVNINITTSVTDNFMEICIIDTGHGFSEEMLEKACSPFTTDKKNHSGLGLAIASTVIYKHNGDLKYTNTNTGSQVTIWLPL